LRKELDPEVGFSKTDREIHIRRVAYVSKLLATNGIIVLVSLVSPYRKVRAEARKKIVDFVEVWVKCSIEKCIERDVKGLYKKALIGEITNMTGIQDPYEEPLNPEVVVDTEKESQKDGAEKIINKLTQLNLI
jgi:adenylyl-sulfate kinase